VGVVRGSGHKVKVKFDAKLKFPGKNEDGRREMEGVIKCAGKWPEVSALDVPALVKMVEENRWEQAGGQGGGFRML
jgi:hypothetical protein